MLAPSIDALANEYLGKVKIGKLNTDDHGEAAAKYGIRSIPTLMIFKGGELAATKVGAAQKSELSRWITASV